MKRIIFLVTAVLVLLWAAYSFAEYGRPMIHTYWHQVENGPMWLFQPKSISIVGSGTNIYSFGSDKENHYSVFYSTDNGFDWRESPRDQYPPSSISACLQDPQKVYYTSPGNNVFYRDMNGGDWVGALNPPTNLNFNVCAVNPTNAGIALVGCGESESEHTMQLTENHGQNWTGIQIGQDYPVYDIGWSPISTHSNIAFFYASGWKVSDILRHLIN